MALILTLLEVMNDFLVYCDALIFGMGVVLMQWGHVIAYASTQLKPPRKITPLMIWS